MYAPPVFCAMQTKAESEREGWVGCAIVNITHTHTTAGSLCVSHPGHNGMRACSQVRERARVCTMNIFV